MLRNILVEKDDLKIHLLMQKQSVIPNRNRISYYFSERQITPIIPV